LISSPFELVSISLSLIITTVVVAAIFFLWIVGLGLKAQRQKPATGMDGMLGEEGSVIEEIKPGSIGRVLVHGEIWKATSDHFLSNGEKIIVESFKNWTLKVKRKE
ncbi:MAG: NfeD family protein, partial [Candidatus Kryptoniota bacterium]